MISLANSHVSKKTDTTSTKLSLDVAEDNSISSFAELLKGIKSKDNLEDVEDSKVLLDDDKIDIALENKDDTKDISQDKIVIKDDTKDISQDKIVIRNDTKNLDLKIIEQETVEINPKVVDALNIENKDIKQLVFDSKNI